MHHWLGVSLDVTRTDALFAAKSAPPGAFFVAAPWLRYKYWFMDWITTLVAFVVVLAASLGGTRAVLGVLRRCAILDLPNERSSHKTPTPRGGGLAVVSVVVVAWGIVGLSAPGPALEILVVCGCALGLAAISWIDDLRGLQVRWRLIGQVLAVTVTLAWMPVRDPYFGGLLPGTLDPIAAAVMWVWFINLFNFMDGIDGIAGTEAACIGAGVALTALTAGLGEPVMLYGLTAAAAALGFLWWNWQPARIFFGDVGSAPLGFLFGWLLLGLAAEGLWAVAIILPLYYLADATITLARRVQRGERIWRAHREHFYQVAVRRGLDHAAVVGAMLLANLFLIALAGLAAWGWPWHALTGACVVVATLLFYLGARPGANDEGRRS